VRQMGRRSGRRVAVMLTAGVIDLGHHRPVETIPPEALLADAPEPIARIGGRLRELLRVTVPDAVERVRPGWRLIGYDVPASSGRSHGGRTVYFAYIGPEAEHIHLGFEHGVAMDDPHGLLQGRGITRRVRWLTFRPGDEPDPVAVRALLIEARRVALLPPDERLAATMAALASERTAGPDRARAGPDRARAARSQAGPMRSSRTG
jgi:hypothetical protein